jgi:hypothetical protein
MPCVDDWKHYRALRWQAFFGWLGGSYLGRFTSDISRLYYALFRTYMNVVVYWTLTALSLIAGFGLLIFTWTRLGWWPCPRCGRPFFAAGTRFLGKYGGTNPFARRCRQCGLRKWACD